MYLRYKTWVIHREIMEGRRSNCPHRATHPLILWLISPHYTAARQPGRQIMINKIHKSHNQSYYTYDITDESRRSTYLLSVTQSLSFLMLLAQSCDPRGSERCMCTVRTEWLGRSVMQWPVLVTSLCLSGLQKDENLVSVLKLFTFRLERGEL